MDAFYASVEQVDNPALKGKPVVVGGSSKRGVVSAASYEARKFGIRSAMPIFQVLKRCPGVIIMPVRMDRYKELSRKVMALLKDFSPLIEQVSVDEAYMDITGMELISGSKKEIATNIKDKIKKETSLNCSIGIAPNKFLAKIASDMNKPNGMRIIEPVDALDIISELPLKKIPGAGRKTITTLNKLGIYKLGEVNKIPENILERTIGKFGKRLKEFSRNIDNAPVCPFRETKSVSSERTLKDDTDDPELLIRYILSQSEIVGRRMRKKRLKGQTITLKLKRPDFSLSTRSVTINDSTDSSDVIYKNGVKLLKQFDISEGVRLIGIGVSNIAQSKEITEQLNLFNKKQFDSWNEVEKAMDKIKNRFGGNAIKRGRLY